MTTPAEPTDVIRLYLDDDTEPFKTARPPLRFQFTTMNLADGPHKLRIEAHNGLAGASIREIPFFVRNGVAITVSGIEPQQEIAGQVGVIINAYAGNTEVDFEPTRAETPQPIPTWAWLVFLVVIAFTMFYVLNPATRPPPSEAMAASESLGQRVFDDTCAKCHQTDGRGLGIVPKLKGADPVLDPNPLEQLKYVVAGGLDAPPPADVVGSGRSKIRMPEFGERLGNADIVAAINHTRTHWGNQAPTLSPRIERPKENIRVIDEEIAKAVLAHDAPRLAAFYSMRIAPRFVRPLDGVDVEGPQEVVRHWQNWLDGVKEVTSYQVLEAAYHVNDPRVNPLVGLIIRPMRPEKDGGTGPSEEDKAEAEEIWVYAHGLVQLAGVMKDGKPFDHTGRFIRFYILDGYEHGEWRLAFDFATLPHPSGCEPTAAEDPNCPPPQQTSADFYFLDVVRLIGALGTKASHAVHGNFWESSYDEFVKAEWPVARRPDVDGVPLPEGSVVKLITPGKGAESNLVKALRDGADIVVTVPGGAPRRMNIPREPRGSNRFMAYDDIARISAWIDRGMPKEKPIAGATTPPREKPPAPPGPVAAAGWQADDVDYAGVQEIFRAMKPKGKSAPHRDFWEKPHAEFVKFEFPLRSQDGKVALLEKDVSGVTNLVKALRDGKGLIATMPDGSKQKVDIERMPSNSTKPMSDDDIRRIERWVEHGAPETKPGAAGTAPPAPQAPPPAPGPAAGDPPAPPTPAPAPAPAPGDGQGDDYAAVQEIFRAMKPKGKSAPHRDFWEKPYAEFVKFEFALRSQDGKIVLLEKDEAGATNLVKALRDGKGLIATMPDGSKQRVDIERMPSNSTKPMPDEDIRRIERWIERGMPQ